MSNGAEAIQTKLKGLVHDGMSEQDALSNVFDRDDTARILDANGWWEVPNNPISCVGVFHYLGKNIPGAEPDKIYAVYRPAEELGSPETMESIRLLPWVDDHLMLGEVPNGTPAEMKGIHGVIGEKISFDGRTIFANIKMFSKALADLIASGKKELSLGYRCKYEYAPGTYQGIPYDYVQRFIRANHLASVDEGRMGPEVAVLDSNISTTDKGNQMADPTNDTPADNTPAADTPAAPAQMSLADAIGAIQAVMPVLQQLMAAQAAAAGEAAAEAATDPAPAGETDEEKAARLAAEAAAAANADPSAAAMDARIKRLEVAQARMTPAAIGASLAARDQLAARLTPHVGTFDHSTMSEQQVAAYGVKKLNIKAPAGQESAALAGYLHAAVAPNARSVTTSAMDSADKPSFLTGYLTGNTK